MQFTEQQKAFIKQYAEFEKKYGKGNVFIRYVNGFWKCRFIVHYKGDFGFTQLDPQIHERVVTSLQKRGVIKSYDIHHNVVDANDRSVTLVGGRIDLSKIKGGYKYEK